MGLEWLESDRAPVLPSMRSKQISPVHMLNGLDWYDRDNKDRNSCNLLRDDFLITHGPLELQEPIPSIHHIPF